MTSFPRSEPASNLPPTPPDNGFRGFQESDFSLPVTELFARACANFENRNALTGEELLTYSDLNERSARVASALVESHADVGETVAILAGPEIPFVVAALGLLRAGHAFLPLDPQHDTKLLHKTLERAGVDTVIVAPAHTELANSIDGPRFIELLSLERYDKASKLPRIEPESLACVFYTSGSTGEPVGVRMSHAFLTFDVCRQANDLSVGAADRFDLLFSPAFSAALAPVFTALICGASLHLLDLRARGVGALPEWLEQQRITISNQSTSTMRAAVGLLSGTQRLPELRLLCVGGEPLRASDCLLVREKLHENCVLQNAMASTETRTYAQFFVRPTDSVTDPVPIGFAVLGRQLQVVDENGREVALGEVGEIVIIAKHLANGYQGSLALTETRFERLEDSRIRFHTGDRARVDPDGRLIHLGRADSIVKVHGYRVDLNEVERHVRGLNLGAEVHALAFLDAKAEPAIGVALASTKSPTLGQLRANLSTLLPDYALPVRLLVVPELPQNANNKVDRRKLRDQLERMRQEPDSAQAPSNSIESELYAVWSKLLPNASFDRETSFFDAGGDSLSSVMLLTEIEHRFKKQVTHAQLQRSPSITRLAELIATESTRSQNIVDIPRTCPGSGGPNVFLLPAITGHTPSLANLAKLSTSECDFKWLSPISTSEVEADRFSIEWVAERYATEILERSTDKPVALIGFSWGAYVAHELACLLKESGVEVRLLALLDSRISMSALPKPLSRTRRLLAQCANLPAWIRYDLLTVDWQSLRTRIAGVFAESKESSEPNLKSYFGREEFSQSFEDEFFVRYRAAMKFKPRVWHGPTAVVRAQAQSLRDPRPGALGWEHFVQPAPDLFTIPGHHESFLLAPHVHKLVPSLDRYLR